MLGGNATLLEYQRWAKMQCGMHRASTGPVCQYLCESAIRSEELRHLWP
jgi:hypothetical protein